MPADRSSADRSSAARRPVWMRWFFAVFLAAAGTAFGLVAGSAGAMAFIYLGEPNFAAEGDNHYYEALVQSIRQSGAPLGAACLALGAWLGSRI